MSFNSYLLKFKITILSSSHKDRLNFLKPQTSLQEIVTKANAKPKKSRTFAPQHIYYGNNSIDNNMKKNIIKIAIVALAAFVAPTTTRAQLSEILNAIKGSSSTASTVTDIVGNLLGSGKVSESSLQGTWVYTEPCVAFESDDVLSKLGGSVASTKIEDKFNTALTKAGIKPGNVTITFNADSTFAITVGKKTLSGTYAVNESELDLTFKTTGRTVKTNVKLSLGTLQIAMNADKMLDVITTIATKASAYSSQMSTISSLLGNYKGMYLGMKFQKK